MPNPAAKHTDELRRELAGGPDPKTVFDSFYF